MRFSGILDGSFISAAVPYYFEKFLVDIIKNSFFAYNYSIDTHRKSNNHI